MKTKEELNALKEEFETVSRKLSGLTEEELEQVSGGAEKYLSDIPLPQNCAWNGTPSPEWKSTMNF